MKITLIAAMAENRVIGRAGTLPWRLPDDQRFFRRLTTGHPVVMGRKTFESIGKPLPNRSNLVVSRRDFSRCPGIHGFAKLSQAEAWVRGQGFEELFVIGGEALYREAMQRAERIYLTRVEAEPEGDAFFPEIDESRWHCVEQKAHPADERHSHDFSFEVWERRN